MCQRAYNYGAGLHKVDRESVVKMGQKMEQKMGQKRI